MLETIKTITERNKDIIPEISRVISRIIFDHSEEKFSIPQIRCISNQHRPENCVRILENLLAQADNENISNILQRVQNIPGGMGARILLTAMEAQESDLPQNKFNLPEEKLKSVKDELIETNLTSYLRAKGVTREGVKGGLRNNSGNILLSADIEKLVVGYLETEVPLTTINPSEGRRTSSLVDTHGQGGCCTIS